VLGQPSWTRPCSLWKSGSGTSHILRSWLLVKLAQMWAVVNRLSTMMWHVGILRGQASIRHGLREHVDAQSSMQVYKLIVSHKPAISISTSSHLRNSLAARPCPWNCLSVVAAGPCGITVEPFTTRPQLATQRRSRTSLWCTASHARLSWNSHAGSTDAPDVQGGVRYPMSAAGLLQTWRCQRVGRRHTCGWT
jgi:hypothetical protein